MGLSELYVSQVARNNALNHTMMDDQNPLTSMKLASVLFQEFDWVHIIDDLYIHHKHSISQRLPTTNPICSSTQSQKT
jgi:hypothetical protein